MLLILIPIAWLVVATLVVCLCRMAAMADTPASRHTPQGTVRFQILALEPARFARLQRGAGRTSLRARGLATIHPIR